MIHIKFVMMRRIKVATLIRKSITVPSSDETLVKVAPGDPWPLPYRGSKYSINKIGNTLKMSWNRLIWSFGAIS